MISHLSYLSFFVLWSKKEIKVRRINILRARTVGMFDGPASSKGPGVLS